MNFIDKSQIMQGIGPDSTAEVLEKAVGHKYVSKKVGPGGKWVYIYENKDQSKNFDKVDELERELKEVEGDRKQLLFEMEQEVGDAPEEEKDKVGNEYGERLNNFDAQIEKIKGKISKINVDPYITKQSDEYVPAPILRMESLKKETLQEELSRLKSELKSLNNKKDEGYTNEERERMYKVMKRIVALKGRGF